MAHPTGFEPVTSAFGAQRYFVYAIDLLAYYICQLSDCPSIAHENIAKISENCI